MIPSRRRFLRFGAGAATAATMSWPWTGLLRAASFEPAHSRPDDGFIRLDSNENAYGPSAKVEDAIKSAAAAANRYPGAEHDRLAEAIAAVHRVKREQVLCGCGSTEILRLAAFAFLGNGKQLIQASPTFEAMEHYARAAGSTVTSVPLTPAFAHDLDAMLARATPSAMVYICNPNNPTASLTPRKDLENFIRKLPASNYVVIDEAYHEYAGTSGMYASFIDRPLEDERVIVTRTFSGIYGLAGLRLGYAVGSPTTMQLLRKFSAEDNINVIAARAAAAALDDVDGVNDFVERNANDRQEFFNQAMARALKPIDSHANFVMMNTFHPTDEVIEHFHQNKILIGRRFAPMDTYIRVSLGLPEEMREFWRAWDLLPYAKNIMHH
ncbi:MAG TPA: histidinol-phosphate transaminase [Terriglobales bacterium]|nr:histidinol-phosphate transaminase [Terriglobales bacterium]